MGWATEVMRFRDRTDAGRRLAAELEPLTWDTAVVVAGLPRGGVPVASEVAARLVAELDVLGVRKLGAPGRREFAVGAVAEDGGVVLNQAAARAAGLTRPATQRMIDSELAQLQRALALYRAGRPPLDVEGRDVVVVDDGLATGHTMLAAIGALRRRGSGSVTVAVPVAPPESLGRIAADADDVICLLAPRDMRAVGRWYQDFSAVADAEVVRLLGREP